MHVPGQEQPPHCPPGSDPLSPARAASPLVSLLHCQYSPFSWIIPGGMQTCLPQSISCKNAQIIIPLLLPAPTLSVLFTEEPLKESPVLGVSFSTPPRQPLSGFQPYSLVWCLLEVCTHGVMQISIFSLVSLPGMMFSRFICVVCQWFVPFYSLKFSLVAFGAHHWHVLGGSHLFRCCNPSEAAGRLQFLLLFSDDLPPVQVTTTA